MEGGEPVVISTSEGSRTMPSVVGFKPNGERLVGVTAKLGRPGQHNDYSEAQGWGVTVACGLTAITSRTMSSFRGISPGQSPRTR